MPIATQSAIVLPYDMEGNILNEIYNFDESVRMQYMHIAVFPLEDESVVLAFYHKRDKLYRQFKHQINSSSQEKVLQYINYLIFEHTENVYFSKKIEEEIKNNKMIEKLSQEANGLPRFGHLSADNMFGIGYEAVKPEDIPNFLDESWAIIKKRKARMGKNNSVKKIDEEQILKRFEYTVQEYIRFYDFYKNQEVSKKIQKLFMLCYKLN